MTDPYQVLGVSPTASDDEVKKAYRTLCKKYHPDANVGKPDAAQAEKKFMEVQQAYEEIMHRRQGGGSWYSQQGQEYGRRTGGMNSVCTTFMLLNLCCACCGGGRMMYAPLFCCI